MKPKESTAVKNPYIELALCVFLGIFGAHRFYAKKYGTAILYLLTAGCFYIGWVVDIVLIIVRIVKSSKQKNVNQADWKPAFSQDTITPMGDPTLMKTNSQVVESYSTTVGSQQVEGSKVTSKVRTYRVTGMQHYMDTIMEMAVENFDYGMTKNELIEREMTDCRIWKYTFPYIRASLVPEPTNPHDKNAIKVLVNGGHVGYIKAGNCAHLLKVMREDRIEKISCELAGGPYKEVSVYYDEEKDKDVYTLERNDCPYFVHLNIVEKQT